MVTLGLKVIVYFKTTLATTSNSFAGIFFFRTILDLYNNNKMVCHRHFEKFGHPKNALRFDKATFAYGQIKWLLGSFSSKH